MPLSAFSEDEVRQIVRFSCRTLVQQGFERPRAFRARRRLARRRPRHERARRRGLRRRLLRGAARLPRHFGAVATRVSQPYRLDVDGGQQLVEVPNNGCLADYVTADQMVDTFN